MRQMKTEAKDDKIEEIETDGDNNTLCEQGKGNG